MTERQRGFSLPTEVGNPKSSIVLSCSVEEMCIIVGSAIRVKLSFCTQGIYKLFSVRARSNFFFEGLSIVIS
ncbi:hypothetical protein TNIN_322961 [Trichonephila inaurata madagascariensis]|uniref:Uncharacterized protein n=1 Tax=Trichonephila inaurata madagascariensis TaxID=2747483 RepID=A0A8X6J837_9ARAC|nr:hypothetical protein TNIN_322961 [Trichonephila inaurata madagascariensis]